MSPRTTSACDNERAPSPEPGNKPHALQKYTGSIGSPARRFGSRTSSTRSIRSMSRTLTRRISSRIFCAQPTSDSNTDAETLFTFDTAETAVASESEEPARGRSKSVKWNSTNGVEQMVAMRPDVLRELESRRSGFPDKSGWSTYLHELYDDENCREALLWLTEHPEDILPEEPSESKRWTRNPYYKKRLSGDEPVKFNTKIFPKLKGKPKFKEDVFSQQALDLWDDKHREASPHGTVRNSPAYDPPLPMGVASWYELEIGKSKPRRRSLANCLRYVVKTPFLKAAHSKVGVKARNKIGAALESRNISIPRRFHISV